MGLVECVKTIGHIKVLQNHLEVVNGAVLHTKIKIVSNKANARKELFPSVELPATKDAQCVSTSCLLQFRKFH